MYMYRVQIKVQKILHAMLSIMYIYTAMPQYVGDPYRLQQYVHVHALREHVEHYDIV